MREQLIQYVNLLFSGAPHMEDIRQEILQNTLDRYDDLISQGKSQEAAYRLAISGIGDINEILGSEKGPDSEVISYPHEQENTGSDQVRKMRAVAVAMYICCAIPLFILSDWGYATIGLCVTILLVAAATYLMMLSRNPSTEYAQEKEPLNPRKQALRKIVNIITIVLYLMISFLTQAWVITWLIFPISGCVEGLINAILDLKEACKHEN